MNPSDLVNESVIVFTPGKKKDSWKTDFQLKDLTTERLTFNRLVSL